MNGMKQNSMIFSLFGYDALASTIHRQLNDEPLEKLGRVVFWPIQNVPLLRPQS